LQEADLVGYLFACLGLTPSAQERDGPEAMAHSQYHRKVRKGRRRRVWHQRAWHWLVLLFAPSPYQPGVHLQGYRRARHLHGRLAAWRRKFDTIDRFLARGDRALAAYLLPILTWVLALLAPRKPSLWYLCNGHKTRARRAAAWLTYLLAPAISS